MTEGHALSENRTFHTSAVIVTAPVGVPVAHAGAVTMWGGADDNQRDGVPVRGIYSALAAGDHHSVALSADGTITAWGNNENGQLGGVPTVDRITGKRDR
ncbi:hypothetical protein ACFRFQ_15950 [Rhodococcus sp. NPDC056743]|uniref:hypothetical protein n=1 Tax=Rhodococcus sp. NPDC056743 TaxID=3345934 RepID=UPI00367200CE